MSQFFGKTIILNVFVSNNTGVTSFKVLYEIERNKEETPGKPQSIGDCNFPLSTINGKSRQKKSIIILRILDTPI